MSIADALLSPPELLKRVRDGRIYGADAFYRDTQAVNDLVRHG